MLKAILIVRKFTESKCFDFDIAKAFANNDADFDSITISGVDVCLKVDLEPFKENLKR